MNYLAAYGLPIGIFVLAFLFFKLAGAVRYIPNNRAAVVERMWSAKGQGWLYCAER
jgi:hypothetical protein